MCGNVTLCILPADFFAYTLVSFACIYVSFAYISVSFGTHTDLIYNASPLLSSTATKHIHIPLCVFECTPYQQQWDICIRLFWHTYRSHLHIRIGLFCMYVGLFCIYIGLFCMYMMYPLSTAMRHTQNSPSLLFFVLKQVEFKPKTREINYVPHCYRWAMCHIL